MIQRKALSMLLFALLVVVFPHPALPEQPPDLKKNPVYSAYDFSRNKKTVIFGNQPLAVPVGVIGEVMKRDRILRRALKSAGWDIRFHSFLKGADINSFLVLGDIDAAMGGDMPTITTAATSDIVIAALAKQSFSSIIAKGQVLISDLAGRRIGYPAGSTAHYGLLIALSSVGMKESDVRMVPLDVNEMSEALAGNSIDAFTAWEPIPTIALGKHRDFAVVQRFLNSSYLYFARNFTQGNPKIAEEVVASFVRSLRWMRASSKNLLQAAEWTIQAGETLQGKPYGATAQQIAEITKSDILEIASSPEIPARLYERDGPVHKAFDFLKQQGKIGQPVTWERVRGSFDAALVKKVVADSALYRLEKFDYEF